MIYRYLQLITDISILRTIAVVLIADVKDLQNADIFKCQLS